MNHLIEAVLAGANPAAVLDEAQVGIPYQDGMRVRSFFDSYGDLRFCTEDDVLIDHNSSEQMKWLREVANQLEADNPLIDVFAEFEGNLEQLDEYLKGTIRRPRRRRFAKKGARFNPYTGKRKDIRKARIARRTARKFRAKRRTAARKLARSGVGKMGAKRRGKLVSRMYRQGRIKRR